jgi:hypothetical protein
MPSLSAGLRPSDFPEERDRERGREREGEGEGEKCFV